MACPTWSVGFLTMLAILQSGGVSDWPQWRGPERDAHSPDGTLEADWTIRPPRLLWMATDAGKGYASVSVVGDRIYSTGDKSDGQHVVAWDRTSGERIWSSRLTEAVPEHGYPGSRCTPTVDAGFLYVVTSDGGIASLSAESGKIRWRRSFSDWDGAMMSKWGYAESPLVDGDAVVCTPGGAHGMVVKLNKLTGREIWRSEAPPSTGSGRDGAGYASLVISRAAGVRQYVTLAGRGVIGVRAGDGKLLWSYNRIANRTANVPTPLVFGEFVFCSSGYGTGSALLRLKAAGDGVTAVEQYFLDGRVLQNHHGGMVKVGDFIYCGHGHNKGFPACLDVRTGTLMWGGRLRGVGDGSASVVCAGKHLVFRYQTGELALVEATPEEYRLRGVLKPEFQQGQTWAHPVICGGRMYLREQDRLMCYEL